MTLNKFAVLFVFSAFTFSSVLSTDCAASRDPFNGMRGENSGWMGGTGGHGTDMPHGVPGGNGGRGGFGFYSGGNGGDGGNGTPPGHGGRGGFGFYQSGKSGDNGRSA